MAPYLLGMMGHCWLFNRSQRAQCGSLCVCQALHPANIEALVGPIAPQRAQVFAALEIPDVDGTITAPTGQPRAIGAPCHAQDHATMPLQRSSKSAVGSPPQAHAAIIAATGQMRPVRTPLHTTDPG